jgi:hypothetical protein
MTCPVCQHSTASRNQSKSKDDNYAYSCINCGDFLIHRHAEINLKKYTEDRWKAAAWIRQNQPSIVTADTVEAWQAIVVPSLEARALKALRWLSNEYPSGVPFQIEKLYRTHNETGKWEAANPFMSVAWCRDTDDANYLISQVLNDELGWLNWQTNVFFISPRGWLQLEGIGKTDSQIGFCAMWFNDEVKTLWTECIEPAIRDAGYEPLRIDGKQHNNKIDDEIIASIRQSKFVISDLTGNRGGVYYEAGFAHGLGLPVIFMCRESEEDNPHFDIRQYNTIFWTPEILTEKRKDLMNRIIATIGKGTYKPL